MGEDPRDQLFMLSCYALTVIAAWIWNIAGGKSLVVPILMTGGWLICFAPWWTRVRRGRR